MGREWEKGELKGGIRSGKRFQIVQLFLRPHYTVADQPDSWRLSNFWISRSVDDMSLLAECPFEYYIYVQCGDMSMRHSKQDFGPYSQTTCRGREAYRRAGTAFARSSRTS
jgi:hypothetical protein